jgi:hypothetical protein
MSHLRSQAGRKMRAEHWPAAIYSASGSPFGGERLSGFVDQIESDVLAGLVQHCTAGRRPPMTCLFLPTESRPRRVPFMLRSRTFESLILTWTCPHCGTKHHPGGIRRLDNDNLQCPQCKRAFPVAVTARKIGCLEIPERHAECGGKLCKRGLAIVNSRELLTVYCDRCFVELKFEGVHVSGHDQL